MLILTAFSRLRRANRPLAALWKTPGVWNAPPARLARARFPRFISATGMALGLAMAPLPGAAADVQRQAWTVATGRTVVLAEYYEIQESGCRAMRAPPVVVKARPTLGKLVINTTTGQVDKPGRCRHIQVPVTRVLYHAGDEPGQDSFGWEIFFQARELGTRAVQGSATLTRQAAPR